MTRTSRALFAMFAGVLATASAGQATAQVEPLPQVVADDNGHYAFARAVVPALLGRRPFGAEEIKVLGDIAELLGRRSVVEMLMRRPEFGDYWSATLIDMIQYQRNITGYVSIRRQNNACFEAPMRSDGDGGQLAAFVRSNPPDIDDAPPGGGASGAGWNMNDLIRSSVAGDDLSSIFLAYLFPLATHPGREFNERLKRDGVGSEFLKLYLTRTVGCLGCHNEENSTTGPGSGWDRLHAIPYSIDQSLFGANSGPDPELVFNVFRSDARANSGDPDRILPWGMAEICTRKTDQTNKLGFVPTSPSGGAEVSFAGLTGTDEDVLDLEQTLREGMVLLAADGGLVVSPNGDAPPLPSDPRAALAYQTAVSTVDRLWDHVLGNRLTIALNFPRNPDQRDALWRLTEDVFLPHGWSLRRVLAEIVLSDYFNRRAPDRSLADQRYPMPMLFDPWVADDPRDSDPGPDGVDANGQGELVRQHSPHSIIRSFATAMDWPLPAILPPGGSGFGQIELMRAIGQYLTQNEAGSDTLGFQGILQWETSLSACAKPSGVGADWIDSLVDQKSGTESWRPTLADMIEALKDRLVQHGRIEEEPAVGVPISEKDALGALFGAASGAGAPVDLASEAAGFGDAALTDGLRRVCATLAKSPQFLHSGVQTRTTLHRPRLQVCNPGEDCGYRAICERARTELEAISVSLGCVDDDVYQPPPGLDRGPIVECPPRLCDLRDDPELFACLGLSGPTVGGIAGALRDCKRTGRTPDCDPRCGMAMAGGFSAILEGSFSGFGGDMPPPGGFGGRGDPLGDGRLGLRCCGGIDPGSAGFGRNILGWAEGATVREAIDAILVRPRGDVDEVTQLKAGEVLRVGDAVVLGPSASLTASTPDGRFFLKGAPSPKRFAQPANRAIDRLLVEAMGRDEMLLSALLLDKGADARVLSRTDAAKLAGSVGLKQSTASTPATTPPALRTRFRLPVTTRSERLEAASAPSLGEVLSARSRGRLQERLAGLLDPSSPQAGDATVFTVTGPSAARLARTRGLTRAEVLKTLKARDARAQPLDIPAALKLYRTLGHADRRGRGGVAMTKETAERNNRLLEKLGESAGGVQ